MAYNPQKPRYTLNFAEKDYELEGSFGLIEAVESALNEDVLSITQNVMEMPVYKFSRLLSTILKYFGNNIKQADISENIVNNLGVSSGEFALLRLHVFSFLKICICKPSDREQVAKNMGEMIGKLRNHTASLGNTTNNSA